MNYFTLCGGLHYDYKPFKKKKSKNVLTENGKYLEEPYYSAVIILHPASTRFIPVNYRIWSVWLGSGSKAGRFASRPEKEITLAGIQKRERTRGFLVNLIVPTTWSSKMTMGGG